MLNTRRSFVALMACVVVATACSSSGGSGDGVIAGETGSPPGGTTEPTGDTPAEGEPDPGATLRAAHPTPPNQWDPHKGLSATVDYTYHTPVYDNLLELKPDLTVGPMLAEDWQFSDDGRTLTLTLREDVVFHDGEPFNAGAVVTNLERAQDLEGALTPGQLSIVESIEATGDYEVQLSLSEADPSFLYTLAFLQAGRMVSPEVLESDPESLATNPVGTGMYTLAEQQEDRAVYEKFDDYWDEELIADAPATYENIGIGADEARYRALEAGEVDIASVLEWRPELDSFLDSDEYQYHQFSESTRSYTLLVNYDSDGLNDPQVRRALNMAFNREAFAELLNMETCVPTASPWPEAQPEYVPAFEDNYPYDPEQAQELLEEAGATDLSLDLLTISVLPTFQTLATAVQAQLGEIGVDVTVEGITPAEALLTFRTGEYDMSVTSIQGYPDPHLLFREWYYGTNAPGTAPEEFVQMDQEANQHPIGSQERIDAYTEVFGYLAEEDPLHLTLCQGPTSFFANQRVLNLNQQSYGILNPVPVNRYLQEVAEG